jgi:alpha-D-ribose 1-methylphosphonate 5-triphosphate synthase subunit PhnH
MTDAVMEGGLASPVSDAQAAFRAIMDCMAQPGTIRPLRDVAHPPAPLSAAAALVVLTLCDHDTPVWLDPALAASEAVGEWIAFHTGAPLSSVPAEAHFAFAARPATLVALDNFTAGTQEYPDRSTTLILQVESLDRGSLLRLEGPGIETSTSLSAAPLPRHFVEQWRQNNARFPRGIDLVLATAGEIACLPRTTRITATGS